MIAKGTTHNNGVKLARYITTGKDGEHAELWELRGFEADNIRDAFRDVHIMAGGTKCLQPFFHCMVRNPYAETLTREQWLRVADRIEAGLGLTDQPRAICFHIDEVSGHEHAHLAWSRIDQETLRAVPLPFFKEKLKQASRELEKELGLTRVKNERDGPVMAPDRKEFEEARRLGVDIKEVRQTIRDCFDRSDCGRSFEAALAEQGLILAQGDRRAFVVIDHEGGIHALGRRILSITGRQIRDRVADLDHDKLPTVEQARSFIREQGSREKAGQGVMREPDANTTGDERHKIEPFLKLDQRRLQGLDATKETLKVRGADRASHREALRMKSTRRRRGPAKGLKMPPATLEKLAQSVIGTAPDTAGNTLEAVAVAEQKRAGTETAREQAADASDKIDLSRCLAGGELARQQQEQDAAQRRHWETERER